MCVSISIGSFAPAIAGFALAAGFHIDHEGRDFRGFLLAKSSQVIARRKQSHQGSFGIELIIIRNGKAIFMAIQGPAGLARGGPRRAALGAVLLFLNQWDPEYLRLLKRVES
jgi:hypothetical protein